VSDKRLGRPKVDFPYSTLFSACEDAANLAELCEKLDVSRGCAERLLADNGIKFQRKYNRCRKKAYKESTPMRIVASLYAEWTATDAEMGRRFHCSREFVGQVRQWMKQSGVMPRGVEAVA
jgi:hypothetical protein